MIFMLLNCLPDFLSTVSRRLRKAAKRPSTSPLASTFSVAVVSDIAFVVVFVYFSETSCICRTSSVSMWRGATSSNSVFTFETGNVCAIDIRRRTKLCISRLSPSCSPSLRVGPASLSTASSLLPACLCLVVVLHACAVRVAGWGGRLGRRPVLLAVQHCR